MIAASNWRPRESNTLQGFCTLTLKPSGIVINECSLHKKNGQRWIGLPGKPQLDSEGRVRKEGATGKVLYVPIVEIAGKAERERFQEAALAAVDALLGLGSYPTAQARIGSLPRRSRRERRFAT